MNIREAVKDKKRIVIKIGSSSLMHNETGRLNLGKIEKLVRTIVDIKNSGKDVVLVSSGAIAVGRMAIGLNEKPDELPVKQACAAIGQAKLMMVYQKIFAEYSTTAAQVLMTKATVMNDKSRRNAQNTFNELLNLGAVPIVNENDTVSTYEIKQVQTFGDNDRLSAIVTSIIDADLLILLSDIDGLYTDDPNSNPDARFINQVDVIDDKLLNMGKSTSGSGVGTGGMATKLKAAGIAVSSGADMVIANGNDIDNIAKIMSGADVGTLFVSCKDENFDIVKFIGRGEVLMDIKLIRNTEDAVFKPINNGLVLQMVDDNYKFLDFIGKKLYILNSITNERYEISPEIKKYNIASIIYAHNTHDYVFYVSAEQITDSKADILLYRYSFDDNESTLVYRYEIDELEKIRQSHIHIYVLEYDFAIIEEIGQDNEVTNVVLRDFNSDREISTEGSLLKRLGLYNIIPLEGNNSVLKLGSRKDFDGTDINEEKHNQEYIGIVNTKQFVSEMMLNPAEITMDILDTADTDKTFAYMKRSENRVIYSKFNISAMSEEVVLYDFENKVKQIRINNDIKEASDLSYTYVIEGNPYTIKKDKDVTYLINLNTQKEEYQIPSNMQIQYVCNDVILVTHIKHRIPFIKKGSEYIEAYKFPDIHHALLKKKAQFNTCMVNGDDLLVFTL